ncbi:prolipoprotein diacylglyceryl transferase, partial [Rhodovulum sulfidophilum]|nr:prolipoprotein diacylglyceryl transferase [Rhodovulum sulfidophilum]
MQAVLSFPDLSPEIFSISVFGLDFALRWYALAYIAGIVLGWRLVVALMRRDRIWAGARPPMRPEQVEELLD